MIGFDRKGKELSFVPVCMLCYEGLWREIFLSLCVCRDRVGCSPVNDVVSIC